MIRFLLFIVFLGVSLFSSTHSYSQTLVINTLEELKDFRDKVNSGEYKDISVKLGSDIDLNNEEWEPIGYSNSAETRTFSGFFDGNGKTIKGLLLSNNQNNNYYSGFFGCVAPYSSGEASQITNITFSGASARLHSKSAIVVAVNYGGIISDCIVKNSKIISNSYYAVGAMVGMNQGVVIDCVSYADIAIDEYDTTIIYAVGGLVGINYGEVKSSNNRGSINITLNDTTDTIYGPVGGIVGFDYGRTESCVNYGDINAKYNMGVGGVVGATEHFSSVIACCNHGSILGHSRCGGVVGSSTSKIVGCINYGAVEGYSAVGGLIGYCFKDIICCVNKGAVKGRRICGGIVGDANYVKMHSCYSIGEVENITGYNRDNTKVSVENCYYINAEGNGFGERVENIAALNKKVDAMNKHCNDILYQFKKGKNSNKLPSIEYTPKDDDREVVYIKNYGELANFRDRVNGGESLLSAVLKNDIIIPDTVNWECIENFNGIFDGNGYSISGLKTRNNVDNSSEYSGFIGITAPYIDGVDRYPVIVKNLTLIEPFINTSYCGGAVVGVLLIGGKIVDCQVKGGDVLSERYSGGLVGHNYGTIQGCFNSAKVGRITTNLSDYSEKNLKDENKANSEEDDFQFSLECIPHSIVLVCTGGIAGYNEGGDIIDCANSGYILMNGINDLLCGGIAGHNMYGNIVNSISNTKIAQESLHNLSIVGGIAGFSNFGIVILCQTNSSLVAQGKHSIVGGVIGYSLGGYVANCNFKSKIDADAEIITVVDDYIGIGSY